MTPRRVEPSGVNVRYCNCQKAVAECSNDTWINYVQDERVKRPSYNL